MSEQNKAAEEVANDTGQEQAASETEQANSPEELHLLLQDARSRADQHWDQVLRLQAELENTRRRAERDVTSAHKFGLEKFVNELLPVKDSLELGLEAASGDEQTVAKLREGTELTLRMLASAMEKFGVKEVNPLNEPFNPELHQAMTMQPSAEHEPNTVLVVMQKGYTLNDRLVRPAMVVVSKKP